MTTSWFDGISLAPLTGCRGLESCQSQYVCLSVLIVTNEYRKIYYYLMVLYVDLVLILRMPFEHFEYSTCDLLN